MSAKHLMDNVTTPAETKMVDIAANAVLATKFHRLTLTNA